MALPARPNGSPTPAGFPRSSSIARSLVKLVLLLSAQLPLLRASPISRASSPIFHTFEEDAPKDSQDPTLWVYLSVALALVLLGGAFAGLTIALMGQDEIYLQVIQTSGEKDEKKYAAKVLRLLGKGKHWVLVTLLLSNVITNETLPIVLDRSLGGGWPAVLGSTVLIVIFGEILPQSVCVRYGLPIGAWMAPFVLALMYVLAPVAWPTAKLLDWVLGKDHGTTYKKAGLKTLVTLHKTLGAAGEQLNSDEVTIISAVLDLKEKPVGNIMTPMADVFTMSADTVLDEPTMDRILSEGYSRIPIHAPDNPEDFVGMLLVKILITYDPEDCKSVHDFALATLPETRAETSCLDIVNFFQEGKSHMVLVSEFPGADCGALGVVTLEDVIEELIGEEIIDESDVYIDVHKAIRRMQPAPRTRAPKGEVVTEATPAKPEKPATPPADANGTGKADGLAAATTTPTKVRASSLTSPESPKAQILRRLSGASGAVAQPPTHDRRGPRAADASERLEQLRRLGPSNLASPPKTTRFNTVKIKPGAAAASAEHLPDIPQGRPIASPTPPPPPQSSRAKSRSVATPPPAAAGGVGEGLLADAGLDAKDGVQALHAGYGTMERASPSRSRGSGAHDDDDDDAERPPTSNRGTQIDGPPGASAAPSTDGGGGRPGSRGSAPSGRSATTSTSTLGALRSATPTAARPARSGSITENIVERGGVTKVVLETTSSSGSAEEQEGENGASQSGKRDGGEGGSGAREGGDGGEARDKKKKRRKKRRKGEGSGEWQPLMGDE